MTETIKTVAIIGLGFIGIQIARRVGLFILLRFPLIIIILYLFIYVIYNIRRPIMVDFLGDCMEKEQRATILSVEAQLRSLFIVIFAPIFGWIADNYSIDILFFSLAIFLIVLNLLFFSGENVPKCKED